ncbi:MAG: hypothetical protein OXB99_07580 [Acidimicrobiaceae bacterium]|nr:hypothetical protein [Acidimicrobiaceae bacterium]
MSMRAAAHMALMNARASYVANGYEVSLNERLPAPFESFVADAVARRDDEFVVVEVKPSPMSDDAVQRLERLKKTFAEDCGWQFDVVTYEREGAPPTPDLELVSRRAREAIQLTEVSPDAACLVLWSAIEGALLWVAHQREVAPARPLPPRGLIQQLTIDGVLSDNQAAELKDFASRRDAIAHGMCAVAPSPEQFDWLGRFALAVADGRHADLHDMVVWFEAHYVSPVEAGVPYVSDLGKHLWLEDNGPFDAEEVLRDQFEDALDADIEEAVGIIERDGYEWARRGEL